MNQKVDRQAVDPNLAPGLQMHSRSGRLPVRWNPRSRDTGCALGVIDLAALVALALLTLAFFWKIALTNRVLAGLDVFAYFYPYRDFASAALREGRLPLWNPYLFMGAPLLANSQAGVLYPANWLFMWLSTPKQIAWGIVLHIWLAGAGTFLFARLAIRLHPLTAFVAGLLFALGGFVGAQVEHVNQLNASAWLPWLLLCLEGTRTPGRRRWLCLLGGGMVAGLILLAGHTQATYIVLFGAAAYVVLRGWWAPTGLKWRSALRGLGMLTMMVMVGLGLAAGQLLPTLELSQWSVRSGGLPYQEAASFSLKPTLVLKAFLPPLIWDPPFSEFVAYIGLVGLALAGFGAWFVVRPRPPDREHPADGILLHGRVMLLLALLGVFLAFGAYNPIYYLLYKVVPGFDLFRAPARWLLLYGFGAALLAGIGLQMLHRPGSWRLQIGLTLLVVLELFVAGRRLAYNNPTAPAAFDSMRTAPAHLLADHTTEPFRFLSMSDIGYDPGDLGDLQAMYSPQLPEDAVYDLVVATKMKEVLAYDLPLRFRLASVDGYDGGLLPIKGYVLLEQLFLAEEEIWPDGRLRQQLDQVPPARLLSLLNVKYVITDKTQDVWIDDVFYDLEHTVSLGEVTLTDIPPFETTHLGVVSYLTGTVDLVDGTPVARVTVIDTEGGEVTVILRAGEHTAEGLYGAGPVQHSQAGVGHNWQHNDQGNDYIAVLDLNRALQPEIISIQSLLPDEHVHIRGLTLVDQASGSSRTLTVDPTYRLVHSGDVKIYQNQAVLPRAFVVPRARVLKDDQAALNLLQDPDFDLAQELVLAEGKSLASQTGNSKVDLITYEPERVQLEVSVDAPAYLFLTDTFYPGWKAEVNGQAAPILRADLYFRAVALDAGQHRIVFRYRPISVYLGLGLSLLSWLGWLSATAIVAIRIGRKRITDV
jgi:hypothetical protein